MISSFSPDFTNLQDLYIPNPDSINELFESLPPDPTVPIRPRPNKETLLERKRRIVRFWRPRNERMAEDEKIYKMIPQVEPPVGTDEIAQSEVLVLNDPYVIVEKSANMLSSQEPITSIVPLDPGMKEQAQKVRDFLYWWRDEANSRWMANINNFLARDEIYYLGLRGWVTGRVMLDPGDNDFPWRYDLIDPITVYPQKGAKGINWLFHVYTDSKINVLNELGWNNDILARIEVQLKNINENQTVEVASYYDDVWHVMFINDEEVWSAPHNYGFVPWIIQISYGPPIRRTDPQYSITSSTDPNNQGFSIYRSREHVGTNFTKWWGVSIFHGIKDVYNKLNRLASAVLTEAMKAPNPPVVIYTNQQGGEVEGKSIDTSIGATTYLIKEQEDFKVVEYGFRPSELGPLMQMLQDARNRGSLPSVMYGEGANFLSGFAVNLLSAGARDLLFPLVKAHEIYLQELFKKVLKLTAEVYPFPIRMIESDPQSGNRTQLTTITPEEIKAVGYITNVYYKNITPQDRNVATNTAAMLVDKKIISMDTARGEEFIGLKNPTLENQKVLGEMAYFDPDVVKSSIPYSLLKTDPSLYILYVQEQIRKMQEQMAMMQMQFATGKGTPSPPNNQPPQPNPNNQGKTSPPPEQMPPSMLGNMISGQNIGTPSNIGNERGGMGI